MITLKKETAEAIRIEMESIPEKYQKPFNSMHEGLAVLREEYIELEGQIFFGEKIAAGEVKNDLSPEYRTSETERRYKERVREEAIQVAAMAARIIQELT